MSFEIHIVSNGEENINFLDRISDLLNERFKSQEDMECRFETYCEDVAQELGGIVQYGNGGEIVFNFTGLDLTQGAINKFAEEEK